MKMLSEKEYVELISTIDEANKLLNQLSAENKELKLKLEVKNNVVLDNVSDRRELLISFMYKITTPLIEVYKDHSSLIDDYLEGDL